MDRLAEAARIIATARLAHAPLAELPASCRPQDETEAYRVQAMVDGMLRAQHGVPIGFKIGCTTSVMQKYLGMPHPCYAPLRTGDVHHDSAVLKADTYRRVGVECEIAIRLGRGLSAHEANENSKVMAAIGSVHAAIEIVDDRYVDWRALGAPTLIADDFFAAGAVLGPPVAPAAVGDLAAVSGTTRINGAVEGAGSGRDVMGHPAAALAWLAAKLHETGQQLSAGCTVLTGSLVETRWLSDGDVAEISISDLGKVSLTLAAGDGDQRSGIA